jgi:hypothetical protein
MGGSSHRNGSMTLCDCNCCELKHRSQLNRKRRLRRERHAWKTVSTSKLAGEDVAHPDLQLVQDHLKLLKRDVVLP